MDKEKLMYQAAAGPAGVGGSRSPGLNHCVDCIMSLLAAVFVGFCLYVAWRIW
jgi:hypothetical protein